MDVRSWRTTPALAALGLAAAVSALAACSSGSGQAGGSPVASLSGHGAGAKASGPLTQAQSDQDFIDFTRCMRAHGVAVPDPTHRPGHAGLSIYIPSGANGSPAWNACVHYIQPIISMKTAGQASWAAANLDALTRFARCMRAHDIPMLDPGPLGQLNLGNVPGITSNYGRYSPQFRAADSACRHFLPPGVRDDGTGP